MDRIWGFEMALRLITATLMVVFASLPLAAEDKKDGAMAHINLDLNGDGKSDLAQLIEGDDGIDLHIYFGKGEAQSAFAQSKPDFIKRDIAFFSRGTTDIPELASKAKGSLRIITGKSISAHHWNQTLTIVYRKGDFLVAGLAIQNINADEEIVTHSCDINFLSGRGLRNKKPVPETFAPIKLVNWSDTMIPSLKPCNP